jgi:hypothetical protein
MLISADLAKASFPILVTPSGIVMLVMPVSANTAAPIEVSWLPVSKVTAVSNGE